MKKGVNWLPLLYRRILRCSWCGGNIATRRLGGKTGAAERRLELLNLAGLPLVGGLTIEFCSGSCYLTAAFRHGVLIPTNLSALSGQRPEVLAELYRQSIPVEHWAAFSDQLFFVGLMVDFGDIGIIASPRGRNLREADCFSLLSGTTIYDCRRIKE